MTRSRGTGTSDIVEKMLNTQPVLAQSTKRKISMLPDLKRQQSVRQQGLLEQVTIPLDSLGKNMTQSTDHTTGSSQATTTAHQPSEPIKTVRYTVSNHSTVSPLINTSLEKGVSSSMSEDAPPIVVHYRKPKYTLNIADFEVHQGETATTTPPVVREDLKSRLEGLRQFKEWSLRIHDDIPPRSDLLLKAGPLYATALPTNINSVQDHEKAKFDTRTYPARIKHDLPLRHDSELNEVCIDAPTPFPSPQVTPIPLTTVSVERRPDSDSPPNSDLHGTLSHKVQAHVQSRSHSKTVTISSGLPSVQLTPRSRSNSRTGPELKAPQRPRSKPRSNPPISFPKDFYERFPDIEGISYRLQERQADAESESTSRVSPETRLISEPKDHVLSEDIKPPATPQDDHGRSMFYDTLHYFIDCPHFCPPANRPLDSNAQPRPDLNFHSCDPKVTRSIIPGACFNCDITNRRIKEDQIIDSNTAQITCLSTELAEALNHLELDDSSDDETSCLHDKFSARPLTRPIFAEDKHDLDIEIGEASELPPSSDDPEEPHALYGSKRLTVNQRAYLEGMTRRIRDLEGRIDHLRDQQDEQIRQIWSGFTPRWGPATLGVQRGRRGISARRESPMVHNPINRRYPTDAVNIDTAQDTQPVEMDRTNQHGDAALRDNGSSSGTSHSTSQAPSASSRSRSRTPNTVSSVVSTRDIAGSRTPGDGKMRIGWIRGKQEEEEEEEEEEEVQ